MQNGFAQKVHVRPAVSAHLGRVHTRQLQGIFVSSPSLLPLVLQLPAQPTQLAWAHPEYGHTLAVGTSAGQVHIMQRLSTANSSAQAQQEQSQHTWLTTTQLKCDTGAVT